ncbi:pickpocket protein 28-like [Anticarsia gemmatalis]|uniref:pickpocket protein 28-like n=1 Tax=Anticarsia gemmatalis TaxID=129554 RepID=UPI003F762410
MGGDDAPEESAVVIANVFGDICIRKARRKRQKILVREIFYDYANNTTLHGLSYTTKRGLSLVEKIFWLITFVASVCICCYQIHKVFIKWKSSPVIVTVSEQLVPVGKVPFPSVTICPQSKIRPQVYNYTEEYAKYVNIFQKRKKTPLPYDKDFSMFEDILQICDPDGFILKRYNHVFPDEFSNASTVENIRHVSTKMVDIFGYCNWRGSFNLDCGGYFSEVLTSEGICFTINALAEDEILRKDVVQNNYHYLNTKTPTNNWTIAHGFSEYGSHVYPAPGKESGAEPDLRVVMQDSLEKLDTLCNPLNAGFKVYVNHPADLPQSSLYYYTVLNGQVSSMALSFSVLNTTESLRQYDPQIRQCYFPDERYLRYFKIYTANNCKIECITNYTYNQCGCVAFYMPHETETKICTVKSMNCTTKAREALLARETNPDKNYKNRCHCLPACNSIDYEAEILKTDYNLKRYVKAETTARNDKNAVKHVKGKQYSRLDMFFKRARFVSMRRSELFGLTDFLANIGGLLGLFLGFSFLSLVELFYFATLRLCCTLKKDLKEEKRQRRNTIRITPKY